MERPEEKTACGAFSSQWQPVDLDGQHPSEDPGHHPADSSGTDDLVTQCAKTNQLLRDKFSKDTQSLHSLVANMESQLLDLESERDSLVEKTNQALKHVLEVQEKRQEDRETYASQIDHLTE